MNAARAIQFLEVIRKRTEALSKATGVPVDALKQMEQETEAVSRAIETMKENIDHLVIIVGHMDLINIVDNDEDKFDLNRIDIADNNVIAIAIEPTQEFIARCKSAFNPDSWAGNMLPDEAIPSNVHCPKYFAAKSEDGKKAILFEADVVRMWKAGDLATWAEKIFGSVKW